MRILYIGDIMGKPGREVAAKVLPGVRVELQPDLVIAQSENVTHGSGMSPVHMRELQRAGIDFFSGGNHSVKRAVLHEALANPDEPVIRPANLPGAAGLPYKYWQSPAGNVLIISLLGYISPKPLEIDNPLHVIDAILDKEKDTPRQAVVVNFHGDMSSEKRVIGYYLDGRVTAVIGDHWHVPTSDAMILPGGTAHITDVGMCGSLHSSLGVKMEIAYKRWHDDEQMHNQLEESLPHQFNAVFVESDPDTQLATSIQHIQKIIG